MYDSMVSETEKFGASILNNAVAVLTLPTACCGVRNWTLKSEQRAREQAALVSQNADYTSRSPAQVNPGTWATIDAEACAEEHLRSQLDDEDSRGQGLVELNPGNRKYTWTNKKTWFLPSWIEFYYH